MTNILIGDGPDNPFRKIREGADEIWRRCQLRRFTPEERDRIAEDLATLSHALQADDDARGEALENLARRIA